MGFSAVPLETPYYTSYRSQKRTAADSVVHREAERLGGPKQTSKLPKFTGRADMEGVNNYGLSLKEQSIWL